VTQILPPLSAQATAVSSLADFPITARLVQMVASNRITEERSMTQLPLTNALLLSLLVVFTACEGPAGPSGEGGDPGDPGGGGPPGDPGEPGRDSYLTDPGLALEILAAEIADDGTATATVKITDAAGVPLDRDGLFTEGEVSISLILSWLDETQPGEADAYTAYTTREQTSPITGDTAIQAAADDGGTFEEIGVGDGTYLYTFATAIDVVDPAFTHTVGAYATRTVDGERATADTVFHFRPDGDGVETTREIVTDEACNQCHDPLSAHGGARQEVALCVMCHSPQTTDPDTRNTVDMEVMIHKIHMGEHLPSVAAGTPYQIIGRNEQVHDYSTVVFPRPPQECQTCHQGADGDRWQLAPTRASCGSCHDTVAFVDPPPAGMVLHEAGPQPDDRNCNVCHAPTGSIAGITESHMTPAWNPARPELVVDIVDVAPTPPGQVPFVRFSVTVDGAPYDILASPLARLRATVAGPNTDYADYREAVMQGGGAAGTLTAVAGSPGVFEYTLPAAAAIPADATGSYTIGIEAAYQPPDTDRAVALSPVAPFAVTDTAAVPRRDVVSTAACDSCHGELAGHGGSRRNAAYCALCHNPNNRNDDRTARVEGESILVHSVDLRMMIHRIHAGEELDQPYVLGGFPAPNDANPAGTPVDFGEVRYPGDLAHCTNCHVDDSYALPLGAGLRPTIVETRTCTEAPDADEDALCDAPFWVVTDSIAVPPETAACTGCHDQPSTLAHAEVMTTAGGLESCATCHGPGAFADVAAVHRVD
jgi:OmcA/MtrC family decaheme c-type cytochrome